MSRGQNVANMSAPKKAINGHEAEKNNIEVRGLHLILNETEGLCKFWQMHIYA